MNPFSMVDASLRATILASLRTMTVERGISIIYITHDLRDGVPDQRQHCRAVPRLGSRGRRRGAEWSKAPHHPYTGLLISSIPVASAERNWSHRKARRPRSGALPAERRAASLSIDAPRQCRCAAKHGPPLFRVDRYRAVSCYLYQAAPTLSAGRDGKGLHPAFQRCPGLGHPAGA